MERIVEANALHEIADTILNNVDMLDLLDEDEGDDIQFFSPEIRQAALDLKELAETSRPAPAAQGE